MPRPDSDRPRMFVSAAGETATRYINDNSAISLFACVSHCTCIAQWIEMNQGFSSTGVNIIKRLAEP